MALNITRNHTEVTRKSHGFQAAEMIVDFFCLLLLLQVNDVSVYSFHHIVAGPAAALHDVLIRHADGVHDACCIMAQIMEADMWYSKFFNSLGKTN